MLQVAAALSLSLLALIRAEARHERIDPRLVIAIVDHESRGRADVVSQLRFRCVGLMQICPHTLRACREDRASEACADAIDRLKVPAVNIRVGVRRLAAWRKLCRKRTGRAGWAQILHGFGGFDRRGVICGQRRHHGRWVPVQTPRAVRDVLRAAKRLPR